MKIILIQLRNNIIGFLYRHFFKKIFFKIEAEKIHQKIINLGRILGSNNFFRKSISFFFNFSDPMLRQDVSGIIFKNPIGLAAGFDKDAKIVKIMSSVGFGFIEVGSITGQPCPGNPKPRLWRLPKSKAIVVNYGLNNDGAKAIAERLTQKKWPADIPLGINVAKANLPEIVRIEEGINDYLKAISFFLDIGDYLTINISCPSAYGGQPFTDPDRLNLLLSGVSKFNIKKPIFLKMPPDLSLETVDKIIDLVNQYNLTGFICSNAAKNRNNLKIIPEEIKRVPQDKGGISGKPIEEMTNNLIAYIFQKTKGEKVIIGCGGIFKATDAYKKIKLGASLLQLITGMIFEGPQIISQINLGLCRLLKKDGFKKISQAIGADFK